MCFETSRGAEGAGLGNTIVKEIAGQQHAAAKYGQKQEAKGELHSTFLYATRLPVSIFHIQIICVMHHPDP